MIELLAPDWNHWPDGLTRPEIAEAVAQAGVAGLELGVYETGVELAAGRMDEWRRLGDRHGVPVRALLYSMPPERWPDGGLGSLSSRRRLLDEVDALLAVATDLGIDRVGLWPGADLPGADRDAIAAAVAELAPLAARHGLRIAIEPKPGTSIGEPADVVSIIDATGTAGTIGLLLDTGHEFAAGRDPAAMVAGLAEHLLHVHLGDSDGDPDADLPPGRLHPLDPFLAALDAAGYRSAMSPDVYGAVESGVVTGVQAVAETVERVTSYRARRTG